METRTILIIIKPVCIYSPRRNKFNQRIHNMSCFIICRHFDSSNQNFEHFRRLKLSILVKNGSIWTVIEKSKITIFHQKWSNKVMAFSFFVIFDQKHHFGQKWPILNRYLKVKTLNFSSKTLFWSKMTQFESFKNCWKVKNVNFTSKMVKKGHGFFTFLSFLSKMPFWSKITQFERLKKVF